MTNQQQFFARVKPGALKGWHSHKILPSITGAQAALETGWGGSSLANPPYNNFFGIKAGDDWTGEVVTLPTQEWDGSRYITINDTFRAYPTLDDSIADHAAFFTSTAWRVNNYRRVVGEMDYKVASQALQDSGYATDPGYARKLINIIETYNLQSWDSEAFSGEALKKDETLDAVKDNTNPEKVVGGYISNPASREIEDYAVTFIGDENGKEAEEFLKQYKFANKFFDNYEGRQWENSSQLLSGVKTIDVIENAGNLYKNIVVILGTNGDVDSRYINSLVNTAGRERNIILVDSPAELPNRNKTYRIYENASRQHANVYYANWSSHARINIGSYYNANGPNGTRITINKKGAEELSKFIVESIFQANSRNWNNYATRPVTKSKEYVDISSISYKDDLLESPEGDSSIYNPSLNSQFGFRPGGNSKIMWIERMYEGQEDSPSELMESAIAFMRERSEPGVQYTVNLRDLPEDISLGDEGIIADHEFNPPLYIKARVLEMTTSETNPDNNQVVIGNVEEIFPQEKSDILALQKSLQEQRQEYVDNYFTPKPVDIIIEKSNGNTLSSEGFNKGKNLIADLDGIVEVVDGSATLNLRVARKEKSSYTLLGKIEDNFIDTVDEFVSNIEDDDIVDFVEPIDPETNPQGDDTPNPLDEDPIRELKHKSFIVQYINTSGEVIKEEEVFIYEDSTFTHPVIDIDERIDKIEILFSNVTALNISAIAFLENDSVENGEYSKTRLYAKSFVEGEEVTFKYKNYQWTRVSDNYLADEQWNDKNKFNTTNGLNVTPEDIEGEESTFIVKSFDDDGVYVSATAETVSILSNGKSAYDLWIEAGNEGSELDYLLSLKGKDGSNGTPGEPGADGKTPWTHVAYGNLIDGKIVDFSVDDPTGKEYLGTVTNFEEGNPTDPDVYTWVKVKGEKGEDGASVNSIKEFYITTTSLSPTPTKDLAWKETLQPLTETNKYLWNYERSILSDGKIIETNPIVIGVYGDSGKPGVGIESITEFYLVSASKTTPTLDDPRWSSTPSETDQNNRYLWNREEIKYTDGSIKNIPAAIIGTHGEKGEPGKDGSNGLPGKDGVGITETVVTYAQSTNETTPPETGWSDQVSTLVKGNYLWTKTVWTYSDGTDETGYSVSYIAKDGNDGSNGLPGKDGVGITDTIISYAQSTSGVNSPTSGWSDQVPDVPDGHFLWTKTEWKYTDGTNEIGYSVSKIGEKGADGKPGDKGDPGKNGVDGKDGDPANTINLLFDGNDSVTTANYLVKKYTMTKDIVAGETYTLVLKGSKLASQNFGLWQNGGSTGKGNLTLLKDDLFFITFVASAPNVGVERVITIYQPASATAGPANIEWATLVEGTVPLTHYVASTEQILDDINKRALDIDVSGIEEQVGSLNAEYLELVKNYNALQKDQAAYQSFLSNVEAVAKSAAALAKQVNSANAVLQTNLEKQAEKWNTQEGFIQFDGNTNSMTISSEMGGTQMIIDDEALRFYSGGEQVAIITNQYLQIDRGIFTMSAQIGRHKFAPLSSDNDHFVLSYVSGSII